MKTSTTITLIAFLIITGISCTSKLTQEDLSEKAKEEILLAEKEFAAFAAQKGVPAAFLKYAAEEAVISRSDTTIIGKKAIKAYMESSEMADMKLEWEPEFADAAKSGELGYTYGPYVFSAKDPEGNLIESKGVFHTVWKKQEDGKWKFVWD